ncbi:YadA-like family protein [Aggregatibacter actinomycetemcomitans]|nr:YadA-like family protein [Aggregatibacter actinomycetemcomitans]
MNKIFKVIWCKSSQTWIAVSELCKVKPVSSVNEREKVSATNSNMLKTLATTLPFFLVSSGASAAVYIGQTYNGIQYTTGATGEYYTNDGGTPPYNYMNPGSKSYSDKDTPNTGDTTLYHSGNAAGIAIGNNSNALDSNSRSNGIAIGDYSRATGGLSMAIGSFATADKNGTVAIGATSRASGINSLAMMRQSAATGDYSTAIGSVAWAAGQSSFAFGASATAKGNQSIAIGSLEPQINNDGSGVPITKYNGLDNTQTNGDRSMALGTNAKTNGDDSFAIGYRSRTGEFNTVMDSYLGDNITAPDNNKKAGKAIAFGSYAKAQKESAIALGYNTTSNGLNAIAIGANANASHSNVLAIGESAIASADSAMAIGQGAQSTVKNSLALGTGTIIKTIDSGDSRYTAQSYNVENGVVAVANAGKERRIVNVAGGRNDTDAVNVAQLKFVNDNLAKSIAGNSYTGYATDGHTYQAPVFNIKNAQHTNVKAAVEAAQTNYVSVNSTNTATGSNYDNKGAKAAGSIALGEKAATGTTAMNSIAIGLNSNITGQNTVALGANITATTNGSVILGDSSATDGSHITTNVSSADISGHVYSGFAGKVKDAGHFVSVGAKGNERQIKNVAAGNVAANSTDAINGSQLFAVAARVERGWNISADVATDGTLTGTKEVKTIKPESAVKFLAGKNLNLHQNGANFTFSTQENVTFTNVTTQDLTATGNTTVKNFNVQNGGSINMGNNRVTGVATPTNDTDAVNKQYVDNLKFKYSADNAGKGENLLSTETHFAGTTNEIVTKAENGKVSFALAEQAKSSLKKADTAIQELTVGADNAHTAIGITLNQTHKRFDVVGVNDVATKVNGNSIEVDLAQTTKNTIARHTTDIATNKSNIDTNAKNIADNAAKIAKGFGLEAQEGGSVNKALGQNIKVVGGNNNIKTSVSDGEIKVNLNNTLDLGNGGSVNIGNSVLNNTGLTITNGPTITGAGINAGGKKITGVAEGTEDNDAVNFKQLKSVLGGSVSTEIVEKKAAQTGDENLADISVANGKKAGDMGAKYEVSVSKKTVQKAAQDAIKVSGSPSVSVNKTTNNGVDDYAISFNGTEASKSIPLTYKANGNNAQTVHLNNGLNFTNGAMTVATVAANGAVTFDLNDNTKSKINNALDNNVSNITHDGKDKLAGIIKVAAGTNIDSVSTTQDAEHNTTYTINAKSQVESVVKATATAGDENIADVSVKTGSQGTANTEYQVGVSKNKVAEISKEASAWHVKVEGNTAEKISGGDTVTLKKGNNVEISNNGKEITIGTSMNPTFTKVTANELSVGPVTINRDGINAGNKKISGVEDGTIAANSKDAVTGGQLFAETTKAKSTVEKGDDNIQITPENAADGHINYKVALNPSLTVGPKTNGHPITIDGNNGYISGLTNTSWTGTPTTGRAATEDQLSIVDKKFDNKVSLGGDNGSTTEKALSHNDGIKFNIKGGDNQKYVATSASGDDVTVDLAQTAKDKIDNAADKDLANITDNGKKVITALGAVVKADDSTITVTDETDNTTGQKTYKIKANIPTAEKTAMASGNNTTIEGDGSTANPFKVNLKDDLLLGQKDANGVIGKDSSIKVNGKDGSGVAINGKGGSIALNGKDGANPVTINTAQGPAGVNGTNPKDRLMVNNEAVATIEDGLKFTGDNGTEVISKTLNQKLEIVGGADKNKLSDNNIGVNANNGKLEVKLAKELNDLTSAQFKNGDNTTVIHGNGMTITPKDPTKSVSLTDKGLNNGGNQIVNIDSGLKQADGSTVALKDASGETLKNAANIGDLQKSINDITDAGKNGGFGLSDDNGATAKANLGETMQVKGDGSVTTKVVTDNGKPTLQVGLSNHITVGDDTQAGTISVKGENGKDGVSINGKEASVTFAKDGQPGMSIAATRSADGKDALTLKGKDGKDGISFQEDGRITQVADGVNDKDAVNKSQLDRSIAQAKSNVSAGKNITVTPQKNADGSTTYTVETKDDVEFTTVKTGDTTLDSNGININGGPSVTKDGIHANDKKITGVKDGEISAHSKEAVNGSQLHQTNQNVTNLANNVDKGLNFQGDNQEVTVNRKLGDQFNIRGGADSKKLTQNNIGVTADKNGTMTVQLAKEVNLGADGSLTVGNTTVNNDGVTIKDGPSMTSQGINAGGKRIANVAKGKAPTDAVNMSQLQEVGSAIHNRIDNIDNRVNKMDKRRKAGTASALATAGLMQPHRDGQSALVAAVGQYQSETAVAVGYSRISDNGKYGVKVSFSTNSQGEVGGTAGAGYFW